jgi:L1 cell adhesion molecule like protein
VSRARFEDLCNDLFETTLESLASVIEDAKLEKSSIDDIILVGGSTRIPKVQTMIRDYFGGKEPLKNINPDEAVAHGAAVLAAKLSGDQTSNILPVQLSDVTSLSLGTDIKGGLMSTIIKRNTRIPCSASRYYSTAVDNQTSVRVEIREGERARVFDNNLLGSFDLDEIPKAPAGKEGVQVTFEVDKNGILTATATNPTTKRSKRVQIDKDRAWSTREEVMKMIEDGKRFQTVDEQHRRVVQARNKVEELLLASKREITKSTIGLGFLKESLMDASRKLEVQLEDLSVDSGNTTAKDYEQLHVQVEQFAIRVRRMLDSAFD